MAIYSKLKLDYRKREQNIRVKALLQTLTTTALHNRLSILLFSFVGVVYHFQISSDAFSEYPDLPSIDLKACSFLLPTLNQPLTKSLV